jgi:hypothetical protein
MLFELPVLRELHERQDVGVVQRDVQHLQAELRPQRSILQGELRLSPVSPV